MSSRSWRTVFFASMTVFIISQSQHLYAAGLDLGGALNKATGAVQGAAQAVGGAVIPSGATELFRKIDQALDRVDRVLSNENGSTDKNYRSQEAAAKLKEAQEDMQTIERRYGAKMGKDNPELVSRQDRITVLTSKVTAFQGEMTTAIEKDKEAQSAAQASENAAEAARQDKNAADTVQRQEAAQKSEPAANEGNAGAGKIVFSKSPIDPASPTNLTTNFQAGDTIYGLIQVGKSWREIYEAADKPEVGVMVGLSVDGNEDYQYITLKKKQYIDAKYLILEIAPAPDKMTAYKDPDVLFGEGKGNRKIGPIAFTYDLAQLPAGKHTVKFFVRNYGEHPAVGELVIEGSDFSFYADLHEKVKAASDAAGTMPPAGMINKDFEGQMRKLLENGGWTNILRVVIIDKDWWLDGNTSRYLNVAAAAKDANGQCYWCNTQFTQPKLIDGSWGKFELTSTGIKRSIAEENVNK